MFLMLTALAIVPMIPAGYAAWGWIPGTYEYKCVDGSVRNQSLCTHPTDASVTNVSVPFGGDQGQVTVFGTPVGNVVPLTVPQASFYSKEFYIKPVIAGVYYLWVQLKAVGDGTGSLALANVLDVSPISINVTGDGTGSYTTDLSIGDGTNDGVGAALLYMPLNLSVWFSGSPTDPWQNYLYLYDMNFSTYLTTGFTETRVNDTNPFPSGSATINGYYVNATGVAWDDAAGNVTLVGSGAGLDIYYNLGGAIDLYTDFIFTDTEVLEQVNVVGGVSLPVDKLALLAPYIALASTIILAVAATAIFKHRKKP